MDTRGGGEAARRLVTNTRWECEAAASSMDAELLVIEGDCGDKRAAWATIMKPSGDM